MSRHSSAVRLRSVAFAVLAGLTLSVVAVAAPAHAATPHTITELQAAFDNADVDPLIILGNDISATDTIITVPFTAHLDLNGFSLESNDTVLTPGVTFTVDDSSLTGTGTWNVNGGWSDLAAIMTSEATFVVNGGTISARSAGIWNAGIGGGFGQGGGDIIINGGSVTAYGSQYNVGIGEGRFGSEDRTTVTINGGEVTAEGGWPLGAGIGSGYQSQGQGALVTINGGVVHATGSFSAAGIGGSFEAESYSVVINGGSVTATSGSTGAGIGGSSESQGGSTLITGGVVHASSAQGAGIGSGQMTAGPATSEETVEIAGGTVTVTAIEGAGVGGGFCSSIKSITIGEGATVTASALSSAVGGGMGSPGFGEVTIGGELVIPAGRKLTVPGGELVTVTKTGVISGGGTIAGTGSIINKGIILSRDVADLADGAGLTITEHNYKIGFNGNYSGSAPIDAVRVYAKTFDDGAHTVSTPTRSGYVVTEWNTAADGSGSRVTASSTLAADATLYAQWTDHIYTLSPANTTITAGGTQQFTVDKAIDFGSEDVGAEFIYSSSESSDTTEGPGLFGFTRAGERTITATRIADISVTKTSTLTVEAAAAATLDMTPSSASVDQGGSVTLALEMFDLYGNPLPTDQVIITSDHRSDMIDGTTVTFPTASTHVLTASYSGLSTHVSITVIPATVVDHDSPAGGGFGPGSLASTGSAPRTPLGFAALLLVLGVCAIALDRKRALVRRR